MNDVQAHTGWYRSPHRVIAGVCAGLAEKFAVPVWLVRALWIVSVYFFGSGILLYLLMAFSFPRRDRPQDGQTKVFGGVCLALAQKFDWDIGLVRLSMAALSIASFGLGVLLYTLLYFFLPEVRSQRSSRRKPNVIDI